MPSLQLPLLTQNLCTHFLQIIKSDLSNQPNDSACNEIFRSFGPTSVNEIQQSNNEKQDWNDWYDRPLNLSLADRAYGWLAIITARKVLPIWEQFGTGEIGDEDYSHDPTTILKMAEDLLLGLAETKQVRIDLCNRFYFGVIGVEYQTNKQGWLAMGAAYRALECIFQGNEDPSASNFVMEAAGAFSLIDSNEPGLWFEAYRLEEVEEVVAELTAQNRFDEIDRLGYNGLIEELADKVKNFVPVKNETEKKIEFWEWWLTEAIPQAWNLVQQTPS